MGMLAYSSPGPVPVVPPLPTGTGKTRRQARSRRGTRWSPEALVDLVRWSAIQLGPVEQRARPAPSHRRYELLDRTVDYELWVIQWPQDTGLVFHDHGGSAGAFHITAGMLEETSSTVHGLRLRRHCLLPGEGKSFGPKYVHNVGNPKAEAAISVHAYSPPLTSMTFYSSSSTGLEVSHVETDWEGAP
jgi:hypothetical protein